MDERISDPPVSEGSGSNLTGAIGKTKAGSKALPFVSPGSDYSVLEADVAWIDRNSD
jgi:hypothetical protein